LAKKSFGQKVIWQKSHLAKKSFGQMPSLKVNCSHPFTWFSSYLLNWS